MKRNMSKSMKTYRDENMPDFMSHLGIQKLMILKGSDKLSNLKENNDITLLNCMAFLFNILTN